MKAQVRRWDNKEQKNFVVEVEIIKQQRGGRLAVLLDGMTLLEASTVEEALSAAEKIVREGRLSNS